MEKLIILIFLITGLLYNCSKVSQEDVREKSSIVNKISSQNINNFLPSKQKEIKAIYKKNEFTSVIIDGIRLTLDRIYASKIEYYTDWNDPFSIDKSPGLYLCLSISLENITDSEIYLYPNYIGQTDLWFDVALKDDQDNQYNRIVKTTLAQSLGLEDQRNLKIVSQLRGEYKLKPQEKIEDLYITELPLKTIDHFLFGGDPNIFIPLHDGSIKNISNSLFSIEFTQEDIEY